MKISFYTNYQNKYLLEKVVNLVHCHTNEIKYINNSTDINVALKHTLYPTTI